MPKAKIAIVTGLSGAGKTTLLSMAGRGFRIVNIGDIMETVGKGLALTGDRDELRGLPPKELFRLQRLAYAKFARMTGNIVLDTHVTIESNQRLGPALPHAFINGLNIRTLVYINAPSPSIVKRRRKDRGSRSREPQAAASLDVQRTIDLAILGYLSTHLNVPLYVVDNLDGRKRQAARELARALRESFGDIGD